MNNRNKILYALLLIATGLHASEQSITSAPIPEQAQIDALQDPIALNIIKAMQDCITKSGQVYLQLTGLQPATLASIQSDNDLWAKATQLYQSYISDLRTRYKNNRRPKLKNLTVINGGADIATQLTIQANQAQSLFTRLLDEYIAHLGKVYEKNAGMLGLYRNSYYISSANDQTMPITPNEYPLLLEVLNRATQQKEWGKTVDFKLPVMQENGSILVKSLNLQEIISGIKNVPLPAQYSTAAKIGIGVAAATALGAGVYLAHQAYDAAVPANLSTIEENVQQIENKLNVTVPDIVANNLVTPINSDVKPAIEGHTKHPSRPYDLFTSKADDNFVQKLGKKTVNDITNLPAEIANRAKITWNNVNSENYKPGEKTAVFANKYINNVDKYVYDIGIDPQEAGTQPFDEGDAALTHIVTTVGGAQWIGGLAKSATNKVLSKVGDKLTVNIVQGATQGVKDAGTYGMSQAAIAKSQAANRAAEIAATKAANQTGAQATTGIAEKLESAGNSIVNALKPKYEAAKNYVMSGKVANDQAAQAQQYAKTTAQGYAATQGSGATMQEGGRYTLSNVRATQAAADAATKKAAQTGLNHLIQNGLEYGAAAVPAVAIGGTAQAVANVDWKDLANISSSSTDETFIDRKDAIAALAA